MRHFSQLQPPCNSASRGTAHLLPLHPAFSWPRKEESMLSHLHTEKHQWAGQLP